MGINDRGQMVGYYADDSFLLHGFIDTGGKFVTIDVPDATNTEAIGINAAGDVSGLYDVSGSVHGFVMSA